ncbi:MAG: O-antigen ligase family protein [Candidatus Omnitrophota bacterium]
MVYQKSKIINTLDNIILFSLYALIFFFPVSKALIEVTSTIAIICFIIKKLLRRDGLPSTSLNLPIFIYLAVCFVSVFTSSNFQISSRIFWGKVIQEILFFFVVADILSDERRMRNFIYIFFLSAAIVGIDGIYQYFTHKDLLRNRPDLGIPRIYASFGTPNDFGAYLITLLPFLIVSFFVKWRARIFSYLHPALFLLAFTCLVLSVSRGAWLGFISSVLFLGVWIPSVAVFFIILVLLFLFIKPFFHPAVSERLGNLFNFFAPEFTNDAGSIERKIFWAAGWKMFIARPWIGLGLGTFMFNFKEYVASDYLYGPSYAHNCYLQMLTENGIIGLVSFLLIPAVFFYAGIKLMRVREKVFFWYILLASLAAVLGYSVQMFVDTNIYSLDLGMLFWVLLGIGAAAMNNIRPETVTPK